MEAHTYIRVHTTLRLNKDEEYIAFSDGNRYPFYVNQITYTGGEWVDLSGPAQTKKGRGLVDRSAARKLEVLGKNHPEMVEAILQSYQKAVADLAKEVGGSNE